MKQNRSALVREALREHLKRLEVRASEEQDRKGYSAHPQTRDESFVWEREAACASEVVLGAVDEGMKGPCAVNLHPTVIVSQDRWEGAWPG